MLRWLRTAWIALSATALAGCASGPLLDNPVLIRPDLNIAVENPLYVPLGPPSYGVVFDKVIDVIDEYFDIAFINRSDGRILTFPRIAPGFGQPWKAGSPNFDQRLDATFQTIRNRAEVQIDPARDGGYFIQVDVYKELEDLPRPIRSTAGAASFRDFPTVERQYEVIDPTIQDSNWIPLGHNVDLEQAILQELKKCM